MAKVSRTTPFAHLIGASLAAILGKKETPAAVAAAPLAASLESNDDDDDKDKPTRKDGESDDDYAKRCKEMKAKAKAKADSDKDEAEDDKQKDDDKAKAAASAERARCAAIVAHGVACGAVRQACTYAFDTDMDADVAVATLDSTAVDRVAATPAAPSLADRMAMAAIANVGPDAGGGDLPEPGSVAGIIAQAKLAMDKAQGKA